MSDLISRQDAIDRINKQRKHLYPDVFPQDAIGDAAYRICAEFIERMPSAQPERKTGRWVDGQCSICGCDIPAYIIDWRWQKDMDANFCPNCGAKMEVEHE